MRRTDNLCVCKRCLDYLTSREGHQIVLAIHNDISTCDWCEEESEEDFYGEYIEIYELG